MVGVWNAPAEARRRYQKPKPSFSGQIFAQALDALQERWWREDLPNMEDWMAGSYLDVVRGVCERKGVCAGSLGPEYFPSRL